MVQPQEGHSLTPAFCFNQTALRDFLRLSRASIDDSIIQNLNALVTPAKEGFDPTSTATRRYSSPAHQAIDSKACQTFREKVLFPSWQMRSDVLNYCASVATSPDPDDPDSVLREIESESARERVVDERLDPYSARHFPREARTETLANLVRNERSIENIIRSRSWQIMNERCGFLDKRAEEALDEWRSKKERIS